MKNVASTLQSFLYLLLMIFLLGLIGYTLLGVGGALLAGAGVVALLALSPRVSASWVLRGSGARRLGSYEAPELTAIVTRLARAAGLPRVPELFYLVSPQLNALSMGEREASTILVTSALLQRLSLREVEGVLAHEIGHVRDNDVRLMSLGRTIHTVTLFLSRLGVIMLFLLFPLFAFGLRGYSVLGALLMMAAPLLSAALYGTLSRSREFRADRAAVELTGDPQGLASALLKLAETPRTFWDLFRPPARRTSTPTVFDSHPAVEERVRRLTDPIRGANLFDEPEDRLLHRW